MLLTYVDVRAAPFQLTPDEGTKFAPVTVRVKSVPPAVALLGESDVSAGTGFVPAVIVNGRAVEVPPPGAAVNTVTWAVDDVTRSLAGMVAVSRVPLTKVVVRSAPFHRTTDEPDRLLPLTVSMNAAPPAAPLLGERAPSVGAGSEFETVTETAVLVVTFPAAS